VRCILCCIQRTQVYLTSEQRRQLAQRARDERTTLAGVIRQAVDAYLESGSPPDRQAVLDQTFGALPDLEVAARREWDRGYG
jgi:hypothetical protein